MNDLAAHLERLGLDRYLDAFIGEGFDTWDTLLDIQESDLESLNVKLGHRRKLQRAIAEYRGVAYERILGSPVGEAPSDLAKQLEGAPSRVGLKEGGIATSTEPKRRYRRHPKPDENAPEKAPSAYVIFSNNVREEVKLDNLSFTEIAKLVGDRWQKLGVSQKEPYESQANALKESYNIQILDYKKTESYKEYCQYLEEFKAKHGPHTETKRPKLGPNKSSTGSASVTSVASQEITDLIPAPSSQHVRVGSLGSTSTTSFTNALQPSTSMALTSLGPLPNLSAPINRPIPKMPRAGSPPITQYILDRRLVGQLSTQSSMSDDSGPSRSETYDPIPRASALSLSTPPTGTPPLASYGINTARSEHSAPSESFPWPSRFPLNAQQFPSAAPSSHGSITLPSPTPSGETWREKGSELYRPVSNPALVHSGSHPGSLSTSTTLGPERLSDVIRAPGQRTLPPLRQTQSSQAQFGFQGGPPATNLFNPTTGLANSPLHESAKRPVHESEAADILARLANRSGFDSQRSPERKPHV